MKMWFRVGRSRGRAGRRRALAPAVAMSLSLAMAPALAADAGPVPPQDDPFYVAPHELAADPLGAVLRWRQVSVSLGPVPLTGPAFTAYQILYRTDDAKGQPIANVTTVIVPAATPASGGRKLVSVQDAEDSDDPACAPSYQLRVGEMAPNGDRDGNLVAEMSLAATELAQGYDVVVPDAEGPHSEYLANAMEAHATLDSIRAAERLPQAQLDGVRTPVAMIGYSGGASDTAAANEFAPRYAPELNIVAAAAGGVPVGNRANFDYLDDSIGTGVLMAVSIGINRAYPELRLYDLLNAKGKAFAKQASVGCATSVFASPYTKFAAWTKVADPLAVSRVRRVIAHNALGHATPKAPTFYYNAINDELISIKALDQLVARYCAHGARIEYYRDPIAQEHIEALHDFIPLAEQYIAGRFSGNAVPNTCGNPGHATGP